jgi:hypothetical protein
MNMNVIQQEAVAAAAGMSVDQIVKAGQEEEKNRLIGTKSLKDLTAAEKKKLEVSKVYTKEQLDQAIKAEQAASTQERMGQLTDKLLTLFDQLASGPIGWMVEGLGSALSKISELIGKGKELMKTFLPEGSGDVIKAAAGIALGVVAVRGAFGKIKEFFGKSKEQQQIDLLQQIADNTGGGGGGAGGAGDSILDSLTGGGGRGKKKGLSRVFQAFKKGGFKGGMKSMGRMFKQAGGVKGIATSAGKGAIGMAKNAVGLGPGGPMEAAKDLFSKSASSGSKAASAGTKAASAGTKAASVGSKAAGAGKKAAGAGKKVIEKGGLFARFGKPLKAASKFLGPILALVESIGSVAGTISDARSQAAEGKKVDEGKLGKNIVKGAAYPLVSGLINMIPGVGTAVSIADAVLGFFGWSPIKWITDNIVELLPDDLFSGLGKMALGKSAKGKADPTKNAMQQKAESTKNPVQQKSTATPKPIHAKDTLIRPGQPPVLFDKNDLILAGTNLTGENSAPVSSGNSNGGGSLTEVAGLLKELIAKVDQPVQFNIGSRTISEIGTQIGIRKTYSSKMDRGYGSV